MIRSMTHAFSSIGIVLAVAASALVAGCFDEIDQAGIGSWESKAQMDKERSSFAAVTVVGQIMVFGGNDRQSECAQKNTGLIEVYDPASDVWTSWTSFPAGLECGLEYHVALAVDGMVYVLGAGKDGGQTPTGQVFAYDPVADTWVTKSSMLTPRTNMAAVGLDGVIYAIGGTDGLDVVEAYDVATDTWSSRSSAPTRREGGYAVALDGTIYVIGGYAASGVPSDTVDAYDPAADSWSEPDSLPQAVTNAAVAAVESSVFMLGGDLYPGNVAYDPASGRTRIIRNMPSRRYQAAVAVLDGLIYVTGGEEHNGESFDTASLQLFTPPSDFP
jgi:N-acetylneuraminic acid mutarotase